MHSLSVREKEIFATLKALKGLDFVIIGGYAVNCIPYHVFLLIATSLLKTKKSLKR